MIGILTLLAGVGVVFAQDDALTEEPTEKAATEATADAAPQATEEIIILRDAAPDPANVVLEQVAGGFRSPLYMTYAPDDSGRMFVLQQTGQIYILQDGEQL